MPKDVPNNKPVETIRYWVMIAIGVAGIGWGTAKYLDRYASAHKVAELGDRVTVVETVSKNIEEDYHQLARQLFEIAKAVGAREIPEPVHRKK